jgi:DNA polymerase-3 subunit gamma/tau
VLSRSQVYEFRTISTKAIAAQLRRIMDADGIAVGDDSLQLIARDAEGSMRDGQSKLDQVIAFTGGAIAAEDVATVLGLVGRDLLLDTLQAVADDDAAASFSLAARAVEMGYDLRAVCRELSRVVRDLLVLSVDPSRISDPEIAGEGERERLKALAARFSREDLLRAFDLLTRAESDIRAAAQPRYHLEMALLRWMHLRKLVPIEELIVNAGAGTAALRPPPGISGSSRDERGSLRAMPAASAQASATVRSQPVQARPPVPPVNTGRSTVPLDPPAAPAPAARPEFVDRPLVVSQSNDEPTAQRTPVEARARAAGSPSFKDALLAQIKAGKPVFYNMVVAQAQTIDVAGDRVTFTFSPNQRALRDTFEQHRAWLESIGQQVAGRRITAACVLATVSPAGGPAPAGDAKSADTTSADRKSALREQALADAGVQTMLEIFPAEIRDVEEM